MEISARHIGAWGGNPASRIELIVDSENLTINETVTDINGRVSKNLISILREIADELEEHNEKLKAKKHFSDCSIHNEPALKAGECDCQN